MGFVRARNASDSRTTVGTPQEYTSNPTEAFSYRLALYKRATVFGLSVLHNNL